ncbi:Tat binding protein 1(TBP-1)-interacting protein TBPIP [Toxoplasma gondii GAB2-2007-GAL-DOM2]|uniref:TBPIP domain-containing protein n=2 Tax=Toxoplasma gondii TaxID=5811 RepID=B9QAX9_TOXGV|nr:Tat binding protein 1(TBP-1)-interacting protein TBPIP [Toxoplasma gondii VEG]KFG49415.1 Tat binding protein 1(TBP-1)-interacting protein TBPIP [Toxoplasma gondii GAB2-2007-GAL-DOM2]CEL74259.1 TPA: TBPIP domain-containing protein [Toxoplasma gondii VEG]
MGTQKTTGAPPQNSTIPGGREFNSNGRKRTYTKSGDKQDKVKKSKKKGVDCSTGGTSSYSRKDTSPRQGNTVAPLEPEQMISGKQTANQPVKGNNPVVAEEKGGASKDIRKSTDPDGDEVNQHVVRGSKKNSPTDKADADHVTLEAASDHILELPLSSANPQSAEVEHKNSASTTGNGCSSMGKPTADIRKDLTEMVADKPHKPAKPRGRTKGSTKKQGLPNEISGARAEKQNCFTGSASASTNTHGPLHGEDYATTDNHHEKENLLNQKVPFICTLPSQNESSSKAGIQFCVDSLPTVSGVDSHRLHSDVYDPSNEETSIGLTRTSSDESRGTGNDTVSEIDTPTQEQLSIKRPPELEKNGGGDIISTIAAKKTHKGSRAGVKCQKTDKNDNVNNSFPPSERILCYMKEQNRPYNAQIVFDNLKKSIKKPDVERILEDLVAQGSLIVKDIGKMKVYMYEQSQFGHKMTPEEMSAADRQISALTEEIQQIEAELRVQKASLSKREADTAAVEQSDSIQKEINDLKVVLCKATGNLSAPALTADDMNKTKVSHRMLHAEWARRKKICMDILGQISEATGQSVEELVQRLGVEIDEDYIPDDAYTSYS